jgi:hypothetical protein
MPGETRVKADVHTDLAGGNTDGREYPGILGDATYLPVHNDVTGNGTNARFMISKFVSIRVMDARLNGQPKWLVVQPVSEIKDLVEVRLTR